MRLGKRSLAGVAAGALALGMLTVAGTTSANAAPSVKPKATVAGTVSPVRWTDSVSPNTKDTVTYSTLSWTSSAALAGTDTVEVTFTNGPGSAELCISATDRITSDSCTPASGTDFGVIALFDKADVDLGGVEVAAGGTAVIGISSTLPGNYAGVATSYAAGVAKDTVNFSFSTVGAAGSFTMTPATQTVLVSQPATLAVDVVTAAGVPTQMSETDKIQLTTTAGTLDPADGLLEYNDITAVGNEFTLTQAAGGTATITANPLGTWTAPVARTATVVASGTISELLLSDITVNAPVTASPGGTQPNITADIPAGSSAVTVTVTGNASATAGQVVRLAGVASAGTPSQDSPQFVNVTLDANKKGTATFNMTGAALVNGANLTIQQVKANGDGVAGPAKAVLTQATRDYDAATILPSPSGANVAQLGATTPVAVSVTDQFGDAMSGVLVRAFRTNASGTFLSSGTTGANGVANVTVSPLGTVVTGGSETYAFTAQAPTAGTSTTATATLSITYTTSGGITSLTATTSPASTPNPIADTTTAVTTAPAIWVPSDGTANVLTTGTFAVATGVVTDGNKGEVFSVQVDATPNNATTITTPAGVYVSATPSTAWDKGKSSLVVSDLGTAYIFATKTGVHEVTLTSADKTVKIPVIVKNNPADAYNMAITPAEQNLAPGAFGTITVEVTDVFGNPVPGATGATTGGVKLTASGEVLFAGLAITTTTTTGADGKAVVTVVAGREGLGTVTGAPEGATPAWVANFTPPTGAPAPVTSAAAAILVGSEPVEKALFITAYRTGGTVVVDGDSEGFERRDLVDIRVAKYNNKKKKWRKAQTLASVQIKKDESFGAAIVISGKVRVIAVSADGAVKSNRVQVAK